MVALKFSIKIEFVCRAADGQWPLSVRCTFFNGKVPPHQNVNLYILFVENVPWLTEKTITKQLADTKDVSQWI